MATLAFSADSDLIKELDDYVDKVGLNKSKFIRLAIKSELEKRNNEENRQKKNSGK